MQTSSQNTTSLSLVNINHHGFISVLLHIIILTFFFIFSKSCTSYWLNSFQKQMKKIIIHKLQVSVKSEVFKIVVYCLVLNLIDISLFVFASAYINVNGLFCARCEFYSLETGVDARFMFLRGSNGMSLYQSYLTGCILELMPYIEECH